MHQYASKRMSMHQYASVCIPTHAVIAGMLQNALGKDANECMQMLFEFTCSECDMNVTARECIKMLHMHSDA